MKLYLKILSLVAIAIAIAGGVYYYSSAWFVFVTSVIVTISVVLIGVVIFFENRNPSRTMTWLIVLAVFPIVGFFLYLFLGRNYRRRRMFKEKAKVDADKFVQLERSTPLYSAVPMQKVPEHQLRFFKLANRIGNTPISFHSHTRVLTNGTETFSEIIFAIEKAQHHVHLEYFIVRDDDISHRIKNLLIQKAKEGVEIRFIYDSVGCWKLPDDYIEQLREAGVQIEPFFPVTFPFFNNKINFRNHRKIIVVDGQVGFVGGLNIGDEYLGKHPYFGHWRDTHLKIEGEAVRSLQIVFLLDWFYVTNEKVLSHSYLSPVLKEYDEEKTGGVQIIASGPDHEWEVIKKLYFSMITSAKHSILISSPYLIPDEDILSALKIAALSGVDVKIILPNKPDHKLVFWATRSYFTELLEAGVCIYLYHKGFMHSKVVIVDEELASIGSANMDMRSFHLNFEVNAFLFRNESVQKLVKDFEQDLQDSNKVIESEYKKRKLHHRFYESVARLFSPLL